MHVLLFIQRLSVLAWEITLDLKYKNTARYFKTDKSRCMESLTILIRDMPALLFSPSLQDTWTQSLCVCVRARASEKKRERQRKCIGPGSSGCMFEQAVADSHSDDVARGTLAATHTHAHIHVNTLTHQTASTRRPTQSNTRL